MYCLADLDTEGALCFHCGHAAHVECAVFANHVQGEDVACGLCRAPWRCMDTLKLAKILSDKQIVASDVVDDWRRRSMSAMSRAPTIRSTSMPRQLEDDAPPEPPGYIVPMHCNRVGYDTRTNEFYEKMDGRMVWNPHLQPDGTYVMEWVCLNCNFGVGILHPMMQITCKEPFCSSCQKSKALVVDLLCTERYWACAEYENGDDAITFAHLSCPRLKFRTHENATRPVCMVIDDEEPITSSSASSSTSQPPPSLARDVAGELDALSQIMEDDFEDEFSVLKRIADDV